MEAVACAYQWAPVNLRCTVATSRPVYLTGQQVRLKVTLRNADVRFPIVMTPVDGSEVGWRYPHVSFEVRKPTLDELNRLVRTLQQGNPSSVYEAYDVLRAARDVRTVEPLSRFALSNSAAREFAVLILSVIDAPRAAQTVERALEQGMESLTTYRILNELRRHAPDAAQRASRRLLRTSFSDFALRESADVLCDTMGVRATVEEVLKRYQTAERQHAHPPAYYVAGTLRYWLKMRFCPQNGMPPRTSSEWRAWLRRRGII